MSRFHISQAPVGYFDTPLQLVRSQGEWILEANREENTDSLGMRILQKLKTRDGLRYFSGHFF